MVQRARRIAHGDVREVDGRRRLAPLGALVHRLGIPILGLCLWLGCMCVCVRVSVYACVCVCLRERMFVCVLLATERERW